MASVGDEIVNPRTGQRMVFETITPELLEIETWNPPHIPGEPEHVHPRQESGARVLAGSLRFRVHGKERDVGPGESITIPAGAPHHFWNPGDEDAHAIGFFVPSLKTAAFFETYFALAHAGDLDEQGMPSLFQLAVTLPAFKDEIRPTSPPWPLLKTTAILIAPLAKLRGYRATHPYPQDLTTTSAVAAS
jgi:mannose-6-phosphate isomerase-like protein (cupin superfamily)